MNTKTLFLLAITLLLINMIILELTGEFILGTVEEIEYSRSKITLSLKENEFTFVIFTKKILEIKKGDKIKIQGVENIYKGKEQIIVSKIIRQN